MTRARQRTRPRCFVVVFALADFEIDRLESVARKFEIHPGLEIQFNRLLRVKSRRCRICCLRVGDLAVKHGAGPDITIDPFPPPVFEPVFFLQDLLVIEVTNACYISSVSTGRCRSAWARRRRDVAVSSNVCRRGGEIPEP